MLIAAVADTPPPAVTREPPPWPAVSLHPPFHCNSLPLNSRLPHSPFPSCLTLSSTCLSFSLLPPSLHLFFPFTLSYP